LLNISPCPGRLVFVDTEFTTLDRLLRRVWEIAVIIRDPGKPDVEIEWQVRPDLTGASPESLRIGGYYRRNRLHGNPVGTGLIVTGPGFPELDPGEPSDGKVRLISSHIIAADLATICDGAYLVAAVPSADELALDHFMRENGQVLSHHYRLRCVETMALGWLYGRRAEQERGITVAGVEPEPIEIPAPPWATKELWRLVGVPPLPDELAHRALNDARSVRDMWDVLTATK
jgi:hypothetical protein